LKRRRKKGGLRQQAAFFGGVPGTVKRLTLQALSWGLMAWH